ncbi:hypothetical protein P8452_12816 [Trifolium repens]|nr:hypothetical protein P8452_12816 [Trifolium repens]
MNLSFLTKRVGPGFGMYIQGGAKEETRSILELMSDMFWREKTANRLFVGHKKHFLMSDFVSNMNNADLLNFVVKATGFAVDGEGLGQGKPQNGLEGENGAYDIQNAEKLHSLSQNELLDCFHSLGDQLYYLWKIFLKIHRESKTEILEFLRNTWAKDRNSEWSIWMMYSKVEMPHHYINSGSDESSRRGMYKRVSSLWKLPDEPLETAI